MSAEQEVMHSRNLESWRESCVRRREMFQFPPTPLVQPSPGVSAQPRGSSRALLVGCQAPAGGALTPQPQRLQRCWTRAGSARRSRTAPGGPRATLCLPGSPRQVLHSNVHLGHVSGTENSGYIWDFALASIHRDKLWDGK